MVWITTYRLQDGNTTNLATTLATKGTLVIQGKCLQENLRDQFFFLGGGGGGEQAIG